MKSILLFFLIAYGISVNAQGIATHAETLVDPLTGDAHCNAPLITLPGPNGESYPVSVTYSSGIKVDQAASWVGLGWDFNPGEIRRTIHGVPDDMAGQSVTSHIYAANGTPDSVVKTTKKFGPFYYKDFVYSDPDADMDVDISLIDNNVFYYPAFDQYLLDMPGKQTELSPNIFENAIPTMMAKGVSFRQDGPTLINQQDIHGDYLDPYFTPFTQQPQFRIKDALASDVGFQGPEWTWVIKAGNRVPAQCIQNNPDSIHLPDMSHQEVLVMSRVGYAGQCYDQTLKRMVEGNFIQYYTNDDINQYNPGDITNTIKLRGFMDYKAYTSGGRPTMDFPSSGIGAISLTDANGITYHFSLPVYNNSSVTKTYRFDDPNTPRLSEVYENNNRYAISWKLTAITGPDFVDKDNNGIPNEGDEGYWMFFDWAKQADHFLSKYPQCGLNYNATQERLSKNLDHPDKLLVKTYQQYASEGTVDINDFEQYYINSAKTATHTLIFLKDLRYDNVSTLPNASSQIAPSLCLKKVLLFNNRDNPLAKFNPTAAFSNINVPTIVSSVPSGNSSTSTVITLASSNTGLYSYNDYVQNASLINPYVLKAADLNYDYSLCHTYLGNVNTIAGAGAGLTLSPAFVSYPSIPSLGSGYANSGKLTLTSIRPYEMHHHAIFNPLSFAYQSGDKNPDYPFSRIAIDVWGYYKSDYYPHISTGCRSEFNNYRTPTSALDVDAWSLKKITNPSGETFSINYESDVINNPDPLVLACNDSAPTYDYYTFNQFQQYYNASSSIPGTYFLYYDANLKLWTDGGTPIKIFNFKKLYGGGTRVSSIDVSDVDQSQTYTLQYKYSDGMAEGQPKHLAAGNEYQVTATNSSSGNPVVPRTSVPLSYLYSASAYVSDNTVKYGVVEVAQQGMLSTRKYGKKLYQFDNGFTSGTTQNNDYVLGYLDYRGCSAGGCIGDFYLQEYHQVVYRDDLSLRSGRLLKEEIYDNNNNLIYKKLNNYSLYSTIKTGYGMIMNKNPAVLFNDDGLSQTFENTYQYSDGTTVNLGTLTTNPCAWLPEYFGSGNQYPSTRSRIGCINRLYQYALTSVQECKDGITTQINFSDPEPILGVYRSQSSHADGHNSYETTDYHCTPIGTVNPVTTNLRGVLGSKVYGYSNKNMLATIDKVRSEVNVMKQYIWSDHINMRSFNAGNTTFGFSTKSGLWHPDRIDVGAYRSTDTKLAYSPTLINEKNKVLEMLGSGNRYNAVKYGYDKWWPIAEINQGRYGEFTHASVEDATNAGFSEGAEVSLGDGTRILASTQSIKAHTGDYCVSLPAGGFGFVYTTTATTASPTSATSANIFQGKRYIASVWVCKVLAGDGQPPKLVAYNVSSPITSSSTSYQSCGNWYMLRIEFDAPASGTVTVKVENASLGVIYIDDFRFQPVGSDVVAHVYDLFSGLETYSLNSDNFYVRNEYDDAGRVVNQYKETPGGEKKMLHKDYNVAP